MKWYDEIESELKDRIKQLESDKDRYKRLWQIEYNRSEVRMGLIEKLITERDGYYKQVLRFKTLIQDEFSEQWLSVEYTNLINGGKNSDDAKLMALQNWEIFKKENQI